MRGILKNLEGDKAIWAVVALLALFSFLPVYSASSNLVGEGATGYEVDWCVACRCSVLGKWLLTANRTCMHTGHAGW